MADPMKILHLTEDEAARLLTGQTTVYRDDGLPPGGRIVKLGADWWWTQDGCDDEDHGVQIVCPWGQPLTTILLTEPWNRNGGILSYKADGDWISDFRRAEPARAAALDARGLVPTWEPAEKMRTEDIREPAGRVLLGVAIVSTANGWRWALDIAGPSEAER